MPDQDVVLPQPQVAQELDAGDGVDVGVQVAHPDAQLEQVVGQVLGHLLGQGGDERPGRPRRPWPVIRSSRSSIWPVVGDDHDLGVDEAGGPDDLLGHLGGDADLVGARAWPTGRSPGPPGRRTRRR